MASSANSPRSALCMETRPPGQRGDCCRSSQVGTPLAAPRRAGTPLTVLTPASFCPCANKHPRPTIPLLHTPLQRHGCIKARGFISIQTRRFAFYKVQDRQRNKQFLTSTIQFGALLQALRSSPLAFNCSIHPISSPERRGTYLKNASAPTSSCNQRNSNSLHLHLVQKTQFATSKLGRT